MLDDGCMYLDVRSKVAGADGQLDVRFTLDGLHLNGAGYAAWAGVIAPYLHASR